MQRHERLEQDIKVALSSIITYEVKEPEVSGMISVTDVKVTPDQKYATVYVSIYGKKNKEKVLDEIKNEGIKTVRITNDEISNHKIAHNWQEIKDYVDSLGE